MTTSPEQLFWQEDIMPGVLDFLSKRGKSPYTISNESIMRKTLQALGTLPKDLYVRLMRFATSFDAAYIAPSSDHGGQPLYLPPRGKTRKHLAFIDGSLITDSKTISEARGNPQDYETYFDLHDPSYVRFLGNTYESKTRSFPYNTMAFSTLLLYHTNIGTFELEKFIHAIKEHSGKKLNKSLQDNWHTFKNHIRYALSIFLEKPNISFLSHNRRCHAHLAQVVLQHEKTIVIFGPERSLETDSLPNANSIPPESVNRANTSQTKPRIMRIMPRVLREDHTSSGPIKSVPRKG